MPSSSKEAGTKHINTADLPIFFIPDKSNPSPALVKIIMSAIFLSSVDTPRILPSKRLRTYGPNTMPVANIPSNPGNLHFWQIHPIDIPKSKISEILNHIKILLKMQKS